MARKPKPHIPQSTEELNAEWFTSILGNGGTVTAVDYERIGVGIGFVGDLVRCFLTWDDADGDRPRSVIAKLPSSMTENRALGEGIMAYEREIVVYRDIAPQLGLPLPAHIHSDLDKNPAPWLGEVIRWLLDNLPLRAVNWMVTRLLKLPESAMRRFLLVMEDIDDARPAQQFDGGSLDDAYPALELLAQFHAHHWMNQDLLDSEDLIWPINRTPKVFKATYVNNRDGFIERFEGALEPAVIDRIDEVQEDLIELSARMVEPPWTVLHGDYRLDNILYREGGDIVVVDYQLLSWGRAGWDVAYFITTALEPEHRGEEEQMLRAYHDALVAAGVSDYSFEQLTEDTRLTKDLLAHRMIGSGDTIDTQVAGRDETFLDLMVRRVTGWVEA